MKDKDRECVAGEEVGVGGSDGDASTQVHAERRSPSVAKDAEMAEIAELQDAGIGVVLCCGRMLRWRRERGSAVYETECGSCGRSYAMDAGYDYYERDEEEPGESYGRYAGRAG